MPTLQDIARVAEVSPSTVSLVLNGRGAIGASTRRRVEATARQLGYSSNKSDQIQDSPPATTIGIVYAPNVIIDGGLSGLAREWIGGVRSVIFEKGYSLTMFASTADVSKDHLFRQTLENKEIQGAIFIGTEQEDGYVAATVEAKIPTIVFDKFSQHHQFSNVAADHYLGGRQVADHLFSLGHRNIAVITDKADKHPRGQLQGFTDRLRSWDIEPVYVDGGSIFSPRLPDILRRICSSLLGQNITAIFANSDRFALECLDVLADMDIKVPEQMSVIGFDDVAGKSRSGQIPTSVGFNTIAMGESAGKMLLRLIREGDQLRALSEILPTYIVDHGTTGNCSEIPNINKDQVELSTA